MLSKFAAQAVDQMSASERRASEPAPKQDVGHLFDEWLKLAGIRSLDDKQSKDPTSQISKNDALVIIDMQRDFVPTSVHNPNGGRFGVAEGDEIVAEICSMIKAASDVGATIIASRDYHPHGENCMNFGFA